MKKKTLLFLITMLLTAIIISGCGSDDKKETTDKKESETSVEEASADAEKEDESEEEIDEAKAEELKEEENNNESSNFAEMISYMEEETEGTAKVLYENDEPQTHEMEGVSVSLDGYTLVELKDFNAMFDIPFNDQTDGAVVIAKYTVENDTDDDAYYMPALYGTFTGAMKSYNNYKDLLPEDEQLPEMLSPSDDYLIKSGESATGYYTYPLGEDHLKDLLDAGILEVEVPAPHSEKGDVNSNFGKEGKFNLSINDDGSEKSESDKSFYQDKATADNMGEKEMLDEKDGIDKSEKLGDIDVTLDGYQFTEFTPNKEEAPRFESFENGIVLLTVKFNIENENSAEIGNNSITSKLTVNNGSQYMLNEGMLLGYRNDDVIDSGDSGELLQVYILDKEQYDKIWKDKSFELEIGPMKDAEAKDISKGKKATFSL